MAIDNQFGKGIGVAAGFDLGAQKPLDSRIAVNTIEERDAHVENNRAYEGMLVFVDADKKTYQLINGAWVVFFDNDANIEGAAGQEAIDQGQNDRLDALEAQVGKDVDGENPATGLFLEVDQAKEAAAAAAQAAANEESRAMGVEAELQGAINDINDAENGILAQAKVEDAALKQELEQDIADVNTAVGTEETRAKGEEAKLAERLVALEGVEGEDGKVTGGVLNEAKAYVDAREVEIRADIQAVTDDHATRLQTAEGNIDDAQEDILELQEAVAAIKGGDVDIDLKAVNERISALEAKHGEGEATVEGLIDKAQNAADKAQEEVDALELVVGEKAAEGKEASGIFADIAALQADVDQNEKDCDAAMEAEIKNRQDADKALQDQLNAMNGAEGSIAAAIKAAVDKEAEDRADAVAGVQANLDAQLVEANEGTLANKIKTNADAIAVLNGDKNQAGSVDKKIADAIANVNEAAGDLEERVLANENAIKVINGTEEGSIKKAVADLVDGAPEALDTLNELAAALRDNADVLTAVETAFDNKLSAQKEALQKEIDDDVKVVADALANEKDASKEGSLAKKIADEIARADAEEKDIRADFAAADAALKKELQDEIDADVKVVADELEKQMNPAQEGSLAKQIADEKARAEEVEVDHEGRIVANEAFVAAQPDIDKEQDRRLGVLEAAVGEGGATKEAIDAAQDAADAAQADVDAIEQRLDNEGGLVDRIEANEAFVAAQPAIDKAQDDRLKALEDANAEGGAVAKAIEAAQEAAQAAQGDVDAIEERLDEEGGLVDRLETAEAFVAAQPAIDEAQQEAIDDHEERIAALEAFEEAHKHDVMEQGIADNKAAIEKLNGDANTEGSVAKSIADALEDFSTTEEVKTLLGAVVNSLALSMENDKVILKLGGAEGIALSETSLDMATDDDIDAIIAGLDEEEEENTEEE